MNKIYILFFLFVSLQVSAQKTNRTRGHSNAAVINLVFTSDAHYGIKRAKFRGDSNVTGHLVNAAMVKEINMLPYLTLPTDSGVSAGKKIAHIDYLVEGGDVANRMEIPNQSAAASWAQFDADYFHGLTLTAHNGKPTQLLIVPGNHDISNAIGFYRPMKPLTDPTSMVNIYNLMLKPAKLLTNETFDYNVDKVNYSRNIKGIHFMFITLWPDSAERIWMQKDLDTVAAKTPVIIFTHDQPTCEAKHFTNPVPPHDITSKNKFENLVAEYYKEAYVSPTDDGSTDLEQRGWAKFLLAHPNIKAYFHGNSNWNEFYVYHGPDKNVNLNVFRVDSPMKGKFSGKDEVLLSFQLISLDTKTKMLTVRECLWNTNPLDKTQKVVFGNKITVPLTIN